MKRQATAWVVYAIKDTNTGLFFDEFKGWITLKDRLDVYAVSCGDDEAEALEELQELIKQGLLVASDSLIIAQITVKTIIYL